MAVVLKVTSNVKQITSGQVPDTSTLAPGELAFGLITSDDSYHLYGNNKGTVIDLTPSSSQTYTKAEVDEIIKTLTDKINDLQDQLSKHMVDANAHTNMNISDRSF